jgi:flagellar biogenesis protein FliO
MPAQPNARPKTQSAHHPITPRRETAAGERALAPTSGSSPWKMLGALLFAVGGIFGVAKVLKSLGVGPQGAARPLPATVCEVLGIMPLPPRHSLYLLRLGQRVLLLGSTGERLTALSEVTDAEEVASLVELSQSAAETADTSSFFSRLLNHASSSQPVTQSSMSNETNARQELKARLDAFAQS